MHILVKSYDELTPFESKAITRLRLKYGEIGSYLQDAKLNIEYSPRLKPCTKIIIARNPNEVLGWALYTPEAMDWEELCKCKRLKTYYLQLYVATKHRKKGVGTAIVEEARKRAKRLKHKIMVFPHDHASSTLFSKWDDLEFHPAYGFISD